MYKDYFGFIESPFSIVPNSRYLFLSSHHREAMSHLQTGLGEGGGFAMLTGEVGTGKTTVSRAMLDSLSTNIEAGLILNPTFSETELLEAICDEFDISYPEGPSLKHLTKILHQHLLANHSKGVQTLVLIDEAQHLSTKALEQLRLLTNLETDSQKLLRVLLIGQPELQAKLQTDELRQLAQRITGRYHLLPLDEKEVSQYVEFRLKMAGCQTSLFSRKALKVIAQYSQGIPRLINLLCDKALLYAFYSNEKEVSSEQADKASQDVMSFQMPITQATKAAPPFPLLFSSIMIAIICVGLIFIFEQPIKMLFQADMEPDPVVELVHQEQEPQVDTNQDDPNIALSEFTANSQSYVDAMETLYGLWGVTVSAQKASCAVNNQPFHCERRYGNLPTIISGKRPVVLTLQGDKNVFYVVLYGAYGDKVELINSQQRIVVSMEWLKEVWNGEYQTLWYSEIDQTLKVNSTGKNVEKLDILLAEALGTEPVGVSKFDALVESRVKTFQAKQGLTPDGVVGKGTLKHLDKVTTNFAPKLVEREQGKGNV